MTITQIAFVGDSFMIGDADGLSAVEDGGKGVFTELVAEGLANLPSVGPLISAGVRGAWLGNPSIGNGVEWSRSGSWTATLNTDAFDKSPYGLGAYASGAANTMTWTKPRQWRTVVGVAIYWVDYSGGGNWQYRINGGAWTNHGQTALNDNHLCVFYLATAGITTVDFRATSDGSTATGCYPFGIEPFFVAPSTSQGLRVHNLAAGGQTLNTLVAATSGDRMAIYDTVRLGTGSPVAPTPTHTVMMHINDALANNTTTWAADLTTFNTRVSPLGPAGILNPWESDIAVLSAAIQANYRAQTKTSAAGFSTPAKVFDLYDQWAGNGWVGNDACYAAGLMALITAHHGHQSQAGNINLWPRIYWFVRNQLLGLGALSTSYPETAKSATVAYTAKKAAVAYSAGSPPALVAG